MDRKGGNSKSVHSQIDTYLLLTTFQEESGANANTAHSVHTQDKLINTGDTEETQDTKDKHRAQT